ncbi:MAG: glycosyltransferase family 1 protein [Pseudomonadota bacterium]
MTGDARPLLDVTRSLRRVRHPQQSGIDRVERAYLDWTLEHRGALVAQIGTRLSRLEGQGAASFAAFLDGGSAPLDLLARLRPDRDRRMREGEALVRRHAIAQGTWPDVTMPGGVYLNVGHVNLTPGDMAAIRAAGMTRVVMLHDMIPLDYPEFSRPGVAEDMAGKLSAACLAEHLLTNSADTAERARDQALGRGLPLPGISVLPLGVSLPEPGRAGDPPDRPYFVCLGTIEPRKNHRLLLDIWQSMWDAGDTPADLRVIGRRGWLNEDVFERLDWSDMTDRTLFEHSDMGDAETAALLTGAQALLMPSFAEGYGLPLAEALSLGTPALVSNLAALREVGREAPEYLPPDDQAAWSAAILDYAGDHPRRMAQLARIAQWQKPSWHDHFRDLDALLTELMSNRGRSS